MMRVFPISVLELFVGSASANPPGASGNPPAVLVPPKLPALTNCNLVLPPGSGCSNNLGFKSKMLGGTNNILLEIRSRPLPHYSLEILKPNGDMDFFLPIAKPNAGTNYAIKMIH
jgi:hypothetical protein